jgi:hypothetical protein
MMGKTMKLIDPGDDDHDIGDNVDDNFYEKRIRTSSPFLLRRSLKLLMPILDVRSLNPG